jgi:hypothetical protein
MTPRKIKVMLRIATLLTGSAAIAVVISGVVLPVQVASVQAARPTTLSSSTPVTAMAALPPLDAYARVWGHRLRRPLEEPASRPEVARPSASSSVVAVAPPPMALVGTIGTSLAMLRMSDGSTVVKSVGEQVFGAQVLAIRFGAVDVRIEGRTVALEKPTVATSPFISVGDAAGPGHEIDRSAH